MDTTKLLQPDNLRHKNLNYLYLLLSIVLWCSNFVCYYFWYLASSQLQKIAMYDGINDPTSLKWNSSYYSIVDNSLLIGIVTGFILMLITLVSFRKKSIDNRLLVLGSLSMILFLFVCFGGFLSWWTD